MNIKTIVRWGAWGFAALCLAVGLGVMIGLFALWVIP